MHKGRCGFIKWQGKRRDAVNPREEGMRSWFGVIVPHRAGLRIAVLRGVEVKGGPPPEIKLGLVWGCEKASTGPHNRVDEVAFHVFSEVGVVRRIGRENTL